MRLARLTIVFFLFLLLHGSAGSQPRFASNRVIDLTHPFEKATVYWPTAREFRLEEVFRGVTDRGFFYSANNFSAAEHGGTHIDAPVHFYQKGNTVDLIPLDKLIGPGVVVDVAEKSAKNRDYQVQVGDFLAWEGKHGTALDGVIVLLRTGFGRHWPDRERYTGTAGRGEGAVAGLHFPGLDPEAARWLVEHRNVKAIGLDTPSIDYGQSRLFESHVILFEKNIPAFENVANLERLPEKGFTIIALPMKIKGGSGGPLRIVAVID